MAVLASQRVSTNKPTRWVAITHGVFGRGQNWRTIARRLQEADPTRGALLVDLRAHGRSAALGNRPDTLIAAARDVVETVSDHEKSFGPIDAAIGHSFGGKVMLAALAELDAPGNLSRAWIVDASPSSSDLAVDSQPSVAAAALKILESVHRAHPTVATREAYIGKLGNHGIDTGVAQFLAMNLTRTSGGGFELSIDLDRIRALLTDYFATDLWSEVDAPRRSVLHVAVAGRASALSSSDVSRLEAMPPQAGVHTHHFPSAGHWIHADAPNELVAAISASLK